MEKLQSYSSLPTDRERRFARMANLTFILVALFFLLLLAHLFLVYNFNSSPAVPKYYYLMAILGVVLPIAALKLSARVKIKIALLIVSSVFAIYFSEFALFLLTPDSNLVAAKRAGITFDPRTKLEVVEDLRARDIDAYPSVSVPIDLHVGMPYPLGGVSEKTTVQCNESGTYVVYESDEHGFNNPIGSWTRQPQIVIIGDSFAHGFCVRSPQDLAGQLRASGLDVLNLGNFGNGPLTEFAVLREYARPVKPPVILWMYFEGNDLEDLEAEQASQLLMRYYLEDDFSQDLMKRQGEADRFLKQYVEDRIRAERLSLGKVPGFKGFYNRLAASEIGRGMTLARTRTSIANLFHRDRPNLSLFEGILKKSRNLTSSWGGQFYFVYLPDYGRYAAKVDQDTYRHRGEVLSIVKTLDIPVIDIHSAFAAHPDPLSLFPFRKNNHYGPAGYRLAAQAIESFLRSRT